MLNSTTLFSEIGTGLATSFTTTLTTVNEDSTINKKGVIASTVASSVTAGTGLLQEYSYYKTISNAQSYIDAMTDEELEAILVRLEQKENSATLENSKVSVKKRV